jgi:ferredoxin
MQLSTEKAVLGWVYQDLLTQLTIYQDISLNRCEIGVKIGCGICVESCEISRETWVSLWLMIYLDSEKFRESTTYLLEIHNFMISNPSKVALLL